MNDRSNGGDDKWIDPHHKSLRLRSIVFTVLLVFAIIFVVILVRQN
jgi:hypothetical protein